MILKEPDSSKNTIYDGFVVALDWASSDFCIVMHELFKCPHTSVIFNVAACLYTYYWRFISTWHSETWRHIPITFSCFTFKTKNCYMTQLSHFETVLLVWVSCYRWKGGRCALWQSLTDFRFKCKTWNFFGYEYQISLFVFNMIFCHLKM
jgi:hypothetical protein